MAFSMSRREFARLFAMGGSAAILPRRFLRPFTITHNASIVNRYRATGQR